MHLITTFLVQGTLIGFAMAIPVGPMGSLCFSRSIKYGFWAGIITGLGIAVTDAIYSSTAVFGLNFISNFLIKYQILFNAIGIPIIIYIGIKTYQSKIETGNQNVISKKNLFYDFFSALTLTLTNPMTIVSFLVVFSHFNIKKIHNNLSESLFLIFGVFLGSFLWWLFLSIIGNELRHRIQEKFLTRINKVAGIIIVVTAILLVFKVILHYEPQLKLVFFRLI